MRVLVLLTLFTMCVPTLRADELPPPPDETSVLVRPPQAQAAPPLVAPPLVSPEEVLSPMIAPPRLAIDDMLPPLVGPQLNTSRRPALRAPLAPNLGAPLDETVTPGPRIMNPEALPPLEPQAELGLGAAEMAVPLGIAPVRVKDADNRCPGGVITTVKVHAPRRMNERAIGLANPQFVEVVVPPYPAKRVKVNDDGSEVELDFGEYEVEVRFRRDGNVEVDYDD